MFPSFFLIFGRIIYSYVFSPSCVCVCMWEYVCVLEVEVGETPPRVLYPSIYIVVKLHFKAEQEEEEERKSNQMKSDKIIIFEILFSGDWKMQGYRYGHFLYHLLKDEGDRYTFTTLNYIMYNQLISMFSEKLLECVDR